MRLKPIGKTYGIGLGPDRTTEHPEEAMDAAWRERYRFLKGVLDQLEEQMLAFQSER
jgi:hypothetical protein